MTRWPLRLALALSVLNLAGWLLGAELRQTFNPLFPTAAIRFVAGSASSPSVTTLNDEDTGLFFPAANQVGVSAGGTEHARWRSAAYHITGALHFTGAFVPGVHVVIVSDNGKGGVTNAEVLSGRHPVYFVSCTDGDGCPITLGETSDLQPGQLVTIVNMGQHALTFADAAPLHLAGAYTAATSQTLMLMLVGNRSGDTNWYELARSAN